MATPPGVKELDAKDFPALPDGEKLARALNPFLSATAQALRAGLTFRENFAGVLKVLEVTANRGRRPEPHSAGSPSAAHTPASLVEGSRRLLGEGGAP